MRLAAALAHLSMLVAAAPAAADEIVEARARVGSYGDDDATTVISPRANVTAQPARGLRVAAGWAADVITSASVDVTASASKAWSETRHEAYGQVGLRRGAAEGTAGAVYSTENDWSSIGLGASGRLELLERNVTVSARWGLSLEQVGRADDPTFARDLAVHTLEAGLSQLLSPRAVASLGVSLRLADGFQQSVYRFVPVSHGYQMVPERHPGFRARGALTARLVHQIAGDSALHAIARVYADDWGIVSETAELRLAATLFGGLATRLRVRAYHQSSADFYEDDYAEPMTWMSHDRELSTIFGVLAGLKLGHRVERLGPLRWLEVDGKVDVFRYRYPRYDELPERLGMVLEAGLGIGL